MILRINVRSGIGEILEHVDATVKSVRTLINDLRPAVLDLGLVASLDWQARDFERANGTACVFRADDEDLELDDKRATCIVPRSSGSAYQCRQACKSGQGGNRIETGRKNLVLSVADNGIGMPKVRNRKIKSYGLAGIRERIGLLNGEFRIVTGDSGTTLIFRIPVSE